MQTRARSPSRPRSAVLRRRLAGAVVMLLALVVIGTLVLGWPNANQVASRYTALAEAEPRAWAEVGEDLLSQSVRLRGKNGITVDLRVLRPAQMHRPQLPVLVLLGGNRTGRDAVELVGHPGQQIIVALDYPYDGPERIRGLAQSLQALPRIRHALLDTPPAVSLALDWVLTQSWADATRVELIGVSLGTQFAAVAGVLDTRFNRVWLIQGAGDTRQWLVHQLERRLRLRPAREATATLLWWLAHGATLEPQRWVGQIAPRPVVVVGARNDLGLPPELVTALYEQARAPRRLEWVDTGHVHPRRPETVRPLLGLILRELEPASEES